jgi:hypothetical protein
MNTYQVQPRAMRAIAALFVLCEHVIAPPSPVFVHHGSDANPPRGPLSIATTSNSVSAWSRYFTSWDSQHRQLFVASGLRALPFPSRAIDWISPPLAGRGRQTRDDR